MSRFNVPYQVGEGVDHIGFVVVDVCKGNVQR